MAIKISNLRVEEFGHPLDLEILTPLKEFQATAKAKEVFVKLWPQVRQETIALCGSHFHVTQGACPNLYALAKDVFNTLSIEGNLPVFYVEEGYHINSYTLKDKENYYIVLTTGAIDRLSSEEIKFLVGHEFGHLISGHVEFQLLLAFLPESARYILRLTELGNKGIRVVSDIATDTINDTKETVDKIKGFIFGKKNDSQKNSSSERGKEQTGITTGIKNIIGVGDSITRLNKWNRISEYTADRIGLLACQDINVALSTLMKTSGLPQTYYSSASVDRFIEQVNEFNDIYGGTYDSILKELDMLDEDHPWMVRRAAELLQWYESGAYERMLNAKELPLIK